MKNIRLKLDLLNSAPIKKLPGLFNSTDRMQSTAREGVPLYLFTEDYGNRFFKLKPIKAIVP